MPSTPAPVPAPAVSPDQAIPQNLQTLESPEIAHTPVITAVPHLIEAAVKAADPATAAAEGAPEVAPAATPANDALAEPTDAAPVDPTATPADDSMAAPADDLTAASAAEAVAAPARADLNPAACALQLKQLFPALFAGSPKPLKLRIQVDIQERSPGVFSKPMLATFFRRYTGSTAYLIAVSRAKNRFDLDGQPSGELSEEHREVALAELARRRANTESRVALEEQQRRNRATLLHDFGQTTLTPANFCALKGIAEGELDGYLATARREAEERAQQPPAFEPRRPPAGRQRNGPGRR